MPHGALGRREDVALKRAVGKGATQHRARLCYDRRRRTQFKYSAINAQEDTLLAGLTVEQTFRYASLLYSDRDDAIERADALVDALGLKARRHLVVGNALAPGGLSGGAKETCQYRHRHARGKASDVN